MSKVNLIELLSEEEKQSIVDYTLNTQGGDRSNYIGLEAFLAHWNESKQRLYHLLGDNLIYKTDWKREKNFDDLRSQIYDQIVEKDSPIETFVSSFDHALGDIIKTLKLETINTLPFLKLTSSKNLAKQKITHDFLERQSSSSFVDVEKGRIKVDRKAMNKKHDLVIPEGMTTLKAICKVMDFFDMPDSVKKLYEPFRLALSVIFNDKYLHGKVCLSIHPLDFMTMSDNSLNWNSCMTWVHDGCYHAGTVEMMNSNNVICCYLEGSEPFIRKDLKWNNKKWRQLFYVTPQIICGGSTYPYHSIDLTTHVLNTVKELAEENLGWKYQYGPEEYRDMINVDGIYTMDREKTTTHSWDPATDRKRIIFDTKLMYNDFLNKSKNSTKDYLCYRNNPKKNLVISVSGKCNCLSCNTPLTNNVKMHSYSYNDKYPNSGSLHCPKCAKNLECSSCGDSQQPLIKLKNGKKCCLWCYLSLKKCPCCGRIQSYPKFLFATEKISTEEDFDKKLGITKNWYRDYLFRSPLTGSILSRIPVQKLLEAKDYFSFDLDNIIRLDISKASAREFWEWAEDHFSKIDESSPLYEKANNFLNHSASLCTRCRYTAMRKQKLILMKDLAQMPGLRDPFYSLFYVKSDFIGKVKKADINKVIMVE